MMIEKWELSDLMYVTMLHARCSTDSGRFLCTVVMPAVPCNGNRYGTEDGLLVLPRPLLFQNLCSIHLAKCTCVMMI